MADQENTTSAAHAPGPWRADGSDTSLATWVLDAGLKRVCTMARRPDDWENARFIAAAPKLAEALRALTRCAEKHAPYVDAWKELAAARAALAEAGL